MNSEKERIWKEIYFKGIITTFTSRDNTKPWKPSIKTPSNLSSLEHYYYTSLLGDVD
jgi:hypothetical protein